MSESITLLQSLDRQALVERWQAAFGQPAPRYCHVQLLRSALAWELQVRAAGLKGPPRRRILQALTSGTPRRLAPGTALVRQWNGRAHHVSVLANGFEYDGKTYRSL